MAKQRVNIHNTRKGTNGKPIGAKHNDRNFNLDSPYAAHINKEKVKDNVYWKYQDIENKDEKTFDEYEQACYELLFSEALEKRNENARKARKKDRIQTMEQYRMNQRAAPEESDFTIGNAKIPAEPETIRKIFEEYIEWYKEQFPKVILLDAALHNDEASPHIQWRKVWSAEEDGIRIVSQKKALEQMGIERPDTSKPEGRFNNAKMTYTVMCREKQIELAKKYGVDVEEEPQAKTKQGRDLIQYKYDMLKEEYDKATKENERLTAENEEITEKNKRMKQEQEQIHEELLKTVKAPPRPKDPKQPQEYEQWCKKHELEEYKKGAFDSDKKREQRRKRQYEEEQVKPYNNALQAQREWDREWEVVETAKKIKEREQASEERETDLNNRTIKLRSREREIDKEVNRKVTQRTEKQAKSIAEKDRKIEEQEKEIKRLQGQVKAQEYIIEDFERIYEQEQEREY